MPDEVQVEVEHRTYHEHRRDETERAFWRLNDYTHGHPSASFRNEAWTWACVCGASLSISNAPPGYGGRLIVTAGASSSRPAPRRSPAVPSSVRP